MSRLAPAALQLIDEVKAVSADADVEEAGDPDGFDVVRDISFDAGTGKWLAKVLDTIHDERIVGSEEKDGRYVVSFSSTSIADFRQQFEVSRVQAVFDEPDEPEKPVAAKKAAAKKSASE